MHTILKSLWRSKALLFIPLVSLLGLGPIVLTQPVQAQTIDRVSAKPPKGDRKSTRLNSSHVD